MQGADRHRHCPQDTHGPEGALNKRTSDRCQLSQVLGWGLSSPGHHGEGVAGTVWKDLGTQWHAGQRLSELGAPGEAGG